jgi:hypothetical protein
MEGKIKALMTDLRATKDDLRGAIYKLKTWRGKVDAVKRQGVDSAMRKSHKNAEKGGYKVATSVKLRVSG